MWKKRPVVWRAVVINLAGVCRKPLADQVGARGEYDMREFGRMQGGRNRLGAGHYPRRGHQERRVDLRTKGRDALVHVLAVTREDPELMPAIDDPASKDGHPVPRIQSAGSPVQKLLRHSGELFPIMCGLLAGALLGLIRPSMRVWVGALLAVALGVPATVVSGEFEVSWGCLLIDIPLVAISAVVSLLATRRLHRPAGAGGRYLTFKRDEARPWPRRLLRKSLRLTSAWRINRMRPKGRPRLLGLALRPPQSKLDLTQT
jgi:hypothetical protein